MVNIERVNDNTAISMISITYMIRFIQVVNDRFTTNVKLVSLIDNHGHYFLLIKLREVGVS